jgi:hypothetical protein
MQEKKIAEKEKEKEKEPEEQEEDVEEEVPACSSKGLKRKRQPATIMSEQDEATLAEWLRGHECIYRKAKKQYKDSAHKASLWADKAKEMKLESGALLQTWYNSIRTRVGKLYKERSGAAAKEMSDRDKFIWANFSFLADHITRTKGRTAFSLMPMTAVPSTQESIGAVEDSGSEVEEDEEELEPSGPSEVAAPTSTSGGRGKIKGKSAKRTGVPTSDPTEQVMQQLYSQQQDAGRIVGDIGNILHRDRDRDSMSCDDAWGMWMGKLASKIDERLHPEMYQKCTTIMMDLITSSRSLPPLQTPVSVIVQPLQPLDPQPLQQPDQQQQQATTLMDLIPPLRPLQSRHGQQHTQQHKQQQQQQQQGGSQWTSTYPGANWDTNMPTSGEPIAMPMPRPSSTPNLSQSSYPNISGFSDLLNNSMNT